MKIIRSRRKTIALIVERDGSLTVRAPLKTSQRLIDAFVNEKRAWIELRQEQACKSYLPPHRYEEGETFYYLGQAHPLCYVLDQRPALVLDGVFRLDRRLRSTAERVFIAWYRKQARALIRQRLDQLAAQHGFHFERMRITSARTRWGSCSARGTLSFSWRLVMAPPAAVDYVVLHELVHLQHPNHSSAFWSRLEALMPDYKTHRSWLKKNGARCVL
jgi:hypothetical protein